MNKPEYVSDFSMTINRITGDTVINFCNFWSEYGIDDTVVNRKEDVSKIVFSYTSAKRFLDQLTNLIDRYESLEGTDTSTGEGV